VGGNSETHSVELTGTAERRLADYASWWRFLRRAIDRLADDPEPDGLTKFVAPANSGYSGSLIYEVAPFWIVYQLVSPNRVIIISITPQPTRM
jgi:hypothetical protein